MLKVWVLRFVPGTIALGARFVPGAIDLGARFVPGAIALGARFVPGDHFWVPTSTRNFQKNQFFRVKKKFFEFFFCVFGVTKAPQKHIKKIFEAIGSL